VVLVTIDEPDLDAFVIVSRRLLDADQTHLVQIHNGHKIAISVVASQLKESGHEKVSLAYAGDMPMHDLTPSC
jgi:hypothetical protein